MILIQKDDIIVMINMRLMSLMIRLLKSMLELKLNNAIDYEDIYDNIDDYEYPYNHINKGEL